MFAGTLCKSKMGHQAAKSTGMESRWQVPGLFPRWQEEDDRDQKVRGLCQSQAWFLGNAEFPPWQIICLLEWRH